MNHTVKYHRLWRMAGLLMGLVLLLAGLTGCNAAAQLKDGAYKAQMDQAEHGWQDYLTITVSGGKITEVDYDALDEEGNRKSEDADYRASMEPVSGTYPAEFMPKLEQMLKGQSDGSQIEKVTGATTSSNNFKRLAEKVLEKAKAGDTSTAVLELSAASN